LESGELVGEPVAVDVFELEQGAVAGLDDDRGEREFGEPLELEGEGAVGERAGEVVEALALDGGEQPPIRGVDGVVAGGNGRTCGVGALVGEAVGVALAGIDGDRRRLGEGASARDAAARVGGPAVFCVCQKIPSRPLTSVKTNWERACRGRSRTRSTAGPRRRQTRTTASSTMSASSGHASSKRWQ
jgi:hypothetical protein